MKNEKLLPVNEGLLADRMAYESPECNVIELQGEGCICVLTGSGSVDDMPIDDWDSLYY